MVVDDSVTEEEYRHVIYSSTWYLSACFSAKELVGHRKNYKISVDRYPTVARLALCNDTESTFRQTQAQQIESLWRAFSG
jgi:hypothetical protein